MSLIFANILKYLDQIVSVIQRIMEPVSFIVGLTGLFSAAVTIIERTSAGKSYGEESATFISKIEAERLRLSLWGEAVGLAGGGELHERLRNPLVYKSVVELFAWAVHFFEDSERHSARHLRAPIVQQDDLRLSHRATIRHSVVKLQKRAPTWTKIKWAFSGQKKSENLLKELGWFINELEALVPTPTTWSSPGDQDKLKHHLDAPQLSLFTPTPATNSLRLRGRQVAPFETSGRYYRFSQMRAQRSMVKQKIHQRARKESRKKSLEVKALAR